MDEQQRGQRAWDEKGIVEPVVQKGRREVWLEEKAVQGVRRSAAEKERVAEITEPVHNNARIKTPKPRAKPTFAKNTAPNFVNIIEDNRACCSDEQGRVERFSRRYFVSFQ